MTPRQAAMTILHLLHARLGAGFYRWALREIRPLHEDVPMIVRRQRELMDKEQRIWRQLGWQQ